MEKEALFFSLRLSLQTAAAATFFVVLTGVCAGYFLARRNFRGKELFDALLTLPLVLPPTVTGYYLIVLFGRGGIVGRPVYEWTGWSIMFTWHAAVLASFVVSLPLMIKTARAAIESVDVNLINASYTMGRSEMQTAFRIILPLSKKGLLAGAALSFARAIGEFGATLMLAGNIQGKTDTMPLAIYTAVGAGETAAANLMVITMTVFSAVLLYMTNKFGARGNDRISP